MSNLANSIETLFKLLKARGLSLPSQEVRIIEIGRNIPTDERYRLHIPRIALSTVAGYAARFDELMSAGLPWLNMSCYGTYDSYLIIGIETPEKPLNPGTVRTSVNYSGPPASVLKKNWDAGDLLVIYDMH